MMTGMLIRIMISAGIVFLAVELAKKFFDWGVLGAILANLCWSCALLLIQRKHFPGYNAVEAWPLVMASAAGLHGTLRSLWTPVKRL